jgi:hypothetical protein
LDNGPGFLLKYGVIPLCAAHGKRFVSSCAAMVLLGALCRCYGGAEDAYTNSVKSILQKHCYKCHGAQKIKGGLNLELYPDYKSVVAAQDVWETVAERVRAYEMPPETEPGLDFGTHQKLMDWLHQLPQTPRADCDKIASDRTVGWYKGEVMSRRLNRAEYNNSIRDLFGVNLHLEEMLPADGGGGEGFDTSGSALFVSSIHIEKYLAAASKAVNCVLPDDARSQDKMFSTARKRILEFKPALFMPTRTAAEKDMAAFVQRAFRRPLRPGELDHYLQLFDRSRARGEPFLPSLRQAMRAVLVSPNFLFLPEPEQAGGGVQRLDPLPLASKLSYFIWSSMPDDELLNIAMSGQLANTNIYRQQVKRMLADPKAAALGERFGLQWLNLDRLGTETRPDPKKFPEFDNDLAQSMREEAKVFFNHVFSENLPLTDFLSSDYTYVDERLAKLYGINGIHGTDFRKVSLSDGHRGGILGMPGIHALTSFPLRTSPVLRGRWVMEALLGEKVNPPPPDVPALDESAEKVAHVTLRAQLEAHRTKPECASCHDKMDPLGFGLENFDVLGRWRDQDRGQPVDARGTLPGGKAFDGPAGLKQALLDRKDQIIKTMVRKMVGFAYGREINKFDECVVDSTMTALKAGDYRAGILVEQIAASYPFTHRYYAREGIAYEDSAK